MESNLLQRQAWLQHENMKGSSLTQAIKKDFFEYIGEKDRLKDDVNFLVMEVN